MPDPTCSVVGVGEILWDLLPDGPRLGGAPFNAIVHLGRFGCRTAFVSAVGRVELGPTRPGGGNTIGGRHGPHRGQRPADGGRPRRAGRGGPAGLPHAKSDATSADVAVGSTVEVGLDFSGGPAQANASPDASTVLGPAADVMVVE